MAPSAPSTEGRLLRSGGSAHVMPDAGDPGIRLPASNRRRAPAASTSRSPARSANDSPGWSCPSRKRRGLEHAVCRRAQRRDPLGLGEIEGRRSGQSPAVGHPRTRLAEGERGPRRDRSPSPPRRDGERDRDEPDQRDEAERAREQDEPPPPPPLAAQAARPRPLVTQRRGRGVRQLDRQRASPAAWRPGGPIRPAASRRPTDPAAAAAVSADSAGAPHSTPASSAINGATSAESASDGASGMPEMPAKGDSASSAGGIQAATASALTRARARARRSRARGDERRDERGVPPEQTDAADSKGPWLRRREHQDERDREQPEQAGDPPPARGGDRHRAIITRRARNRYPGRVIKTLKLRVSNPRVEGTRGTLRGCP